MVDTICQKFKKTLQENFIFGKITVGKITAHIFNKKSPLQVPASTFNWKTIKKDR